MLLLRAHDKVPFVSVSLTWQVCVPSSTFGSARLGSARLGYPLERSAPAGTLRPPRRAWTALPRTALPQTALPGPLCPIPHTDVWIPIPP